MVSLRFPFSSFPPPNFPPNHRRTTAIVAASVVAATSIAATVLKSNKLKEPHTESNPFVDFVVSHFSPSSLTSPWGSLSLSSSASETETKHGVEFPSVVKESQRLCGIGLRRKCVFGLKNIDVYAFGVYVNEEDVQKKLKEKYGKYTAVDLKSNPEFNKDILASDIKLTVRLQIVYPKLSIRSVRNAFEDSVGSRLQTYGGSHNEDLLQRFTSQFKDELRIPKNCVIELSRDNGHVLNTTIDGEKVGSIQSKVLCQSVLDLYVGDAPFDKQAKEDVMLKLAHVFGNKND